MRQIIVLASVCAFLGVAGATHAQPYDHLKCYKVKDGQSFKSATIDLAPLDAPPFSLEAGCELKGKARQLCIPVDKSVTATDATQLPVSGQALSNLYTCYKIKCPVATVPDVEISDQFGSRTLTKFKVSTLCVPTVEGNVPATTTTSTTICAPDCTGKECGSDGCTGSCGTCQSGTSCTAAGTCCDNAGATCSVPDTCCSESCSSTGNCCLNGGEACTQSQAFLCCSGSCLTTGVCGSSCASGGNPCSATVPCCSGSTCLGGVCSSCVPGGSACSATIPCCAGSSCSFGLCCKPSGVGATCTSPQECCSGTCNAQGLCI